MLQSVRIHRFVLILSLYFAFALRLTDLVKQNIWWDEARNLDVALRPFWQIPTAPELDIQPPLYYWLLHGWLRISQIQLGNDPAHIAFFARFLSLFAGVLCVAFIYKVTLRSAWLSSTSTSEPGLYAPLIASILAAASPFWLAESQETRMYTVGMLFLLAAALCGLSLWRSRFVSDPLSGKDRPYSSAFFFVLFSALALLTHYNALFILAAWYAWWGIWALLQYNRWQQLCWVIGTGLLMLLLVAPILPIALRQIPTYENSNLIVPTLSDYLRQNWVAYLGGYAFDSALLSGYGEVWLWVALAILLCGLLIMAVRLFGQSRNHEIDAKQRGANVKFAHSASFTFLLTWLVGGLLLYYVAVLDRGAFNVRYSSFVTPALYVLAGMSLSVWYGWWKPLGWLSALIVLGSLPWMINADLNDPRFFREDTQGLANWLRANTHKGDLILLDQKYPFGFYYQRYTIDPEAVPVGPETADARYLFVDINTIDQRLNQWANNAQRIFWVQWFESDTDPRHAVRFLLDQVGHKQGEQGFQGYSVGWWQLQPPTHFALAPNLAPYHLRFADAVETVEFSAPTTFKAGHGIPVAIRWHRVPGGHVDNPLKARVALYNQDGARVAQADDRLLNDRHLAPSHWSEQDHPLNLYWVETPSDLSPGNYSLRLLVYDSGSLEPLSIVDEKGEFIEIESTLTDVTQ
ncbi:MAG: hypothetical protein U0175_32470 [Caldilineaceae bacterium]